MLKYQDKKQTRKNKKTLIKIIVLFLFFIATALGIWRIFGGPINFVSKPILSVGNWLSQGFNNIGYYFNSKQVLYNENNFLLEENLALKAKFENYDILEKENWELKSILNRIPKSGNFILANILTKPNRSVYDTVILDVGELDNLKVGNLAYAYGEVPIGKITEVYSNSSLLVLFSSPGQKTEGFINEVNASVELVGRGGGNFETIIPLELNLEKGTKIFLPGFSNQILAEIVEVISNPTDPFKKVILNSPVNIENIKWVQIKLN